MSSLVMDVLTAYGEFLDGFAWEAFCTLTFRDSVRSEECAERRFTKWFRLWQEAAAASEGVAKRAIRKFPGTFALGVERHQSGTLHVHALVRRSPVLDFELDRRLGWRLWKEVYGLARVERPMPGGGASRYLAKYVVKDVLRDQGWLVFSDSLVRHLGAPTAPQRVSSLFG